MTGTAHRATDLSFLGLTPVPEADRPATAVTLLGRLLRHRRTLATYLETCTRCGNCAEQCHSYLGTRDPRNMPVLRADLVRRLYRRYFTPGGKALAWVGKLAGPGASDTPASAQAAAGNELLDDWYRYFYQCNECRRCAVFCPFGIDTAEVTIAAREILTHLGVVPKFLADTTRNLLKTGNNMGIGPKALLDCTTFLEGELFEETGKRIPIPVDVQGAEVLYNPSSSDFFTNTDGTMGVAKAFYAAGVSWTISSAIVETANFGLFFHEPTMARHNQLLVQAGRELGVKRLVAGECGHGWRTWCNFTRTYNPGLALPVVHIHQELLDFVRRGRLRLDRSANAESVTYHDPCNYARAAGLIEEPRELLRRSVSDFREMTPNRQKSFCCGGGSGLLMDELLETRMRLGRAKADCVRASRARILCAPCAICKAQLPAVMKHHKVDVKVKGLTDLVGNAVVL